MTRSISTLGIFAALAVVACEQKPPTGQLAILAPGVATSYVIDGGAVVEVKSVKLTELSVGSHTIAFTEPSAREVKFDIKANQKTVVPTIENQCYVALDVSQSHYADANGKRLGAPKFKFLEQQTLPFAPPGSHYFSKGSLPESRTSGTAPGLYISGTCDSLRQVEADQKAAAKRK